MIKSNNKIVKSNDKIIIATSKKIFTFFNRDTTTYVKFVIGTIVNMTIYLDNVAYNCIGGVNTVVNISLPSIKNYDVIVNDNDLENIRYLYIGSSSYAKVIGIIPNRFNKLINLDTLLIFNNMDIIKQQLNVGLNLTYVYLYRGKKVFTTSMLNSLTKLTSAQLDQYAQDEDFTTFFQNNTNLQALNISPASGTNLVGNASEISATVSSISLGGNFTGDILKLIENPILANVNLTYAPLVFTDFTNLQSYNLSLFQTSYNSKADIETVLTHFGNTASGYIYIRGTITGNISNLIDYRSPNYNSTVYSKIVGNKFSNIYLVASDGIFSGDAEQFINLISDYLGYYTYMCFGNYLYNHTLNINFDSLSNNGWTNLEKSIYIYFIGMTVNGDMYNFANDVNSSTRGGTRTQYFMLNSSICNISNLKYIAYYSNIVNINVTYNTGISQIELDSLINEIYLNRTSYINTSVKILNIGGNDASISGIYSSPFDLGGYTGDINDLTETQLNYLNQGLGYDGNSSNTIWTPKEKLWILINLKISSTNSTPRYRWSATY